MEHLMREIAPITEEAWKLIDSEVRETLENRLVARKIFDVSAPVGWQASSIDRGRATLLETDSDLTVTARVRSVQPFIELRTQFQVTKTELDALARGARDLALEELVSAAADIAAMEDRLVFNGLEPAQVKGALSKTEDKRTEDKEKRKKVPVKDLPALISDGVNELKRSGIDGPYLLAVPAETFADLGSATDDGYPILKHAERLVDFPIVRAPSLERSMLTSCRGGDFEICLGSDFAVGYAGHDQEVVHFYIEELVTFENNTPEACLNL